MYTYSAAQRPGVVSLYSHSQSEFCVLPSVVRPLQLLVPIRSRQIVSCDTDPTPAATRLWENNPTCGICDQLMCRSSVTLSGNSRRRYVICEPGTSP